VRDDVRLSKIGDQPYLKRWGGFLRVQRKKNESASINATEKPRKRREIQAARTPPRYPPAWSQLPVASAAITMNCFRPLYDIGVACALRATLSSRTFFMAVSKLAGSVHRGGGG
jgi:hypothetical protein